MNMKADRIYVGNVYLKDGKPVYITSGQYTGTYGGISNFWYWKPILEDGSLGELEHGYYRGDFDEYRGKVELKVILKEWNNHGNNSYSTSSAFDENQRSSY